MLHTMSKPVGYRLEWKPGEYVYESPEHFAQEVGKEGARVWGLYMEPQPGCSAEIDVYRGWCWVQPKYVYSLSLEGFTPLYLGPVLHEPALGEEVLRLFPSLAEKRVLH